MDRWMDRGYRWWNWSAARAVERYRGLTISDDFFVFSLVLEGICQVVVRYREDVAMRCSGRGWRREGQRG